MPTFEWDPEKDEVNQDKHGVSFAEAQQAFYDPKRIITVDRKHGTKREKRYYCFGLVKGRILTVRFTYRGHAIRIFGAGYWREGKEKYEDRNRI